MILKNSLAIFNFSTYIKKQKEIRRVVITGLGTVNPLGINVSQSWNNLIQCQSGIIKIKDNQIYKNDLRYPDVFMSPVHKDFIYDNWKIAFTNSNVNKYAIAACEEALLDANINFNDNTQSTEKLRYRTGVNIGVMNSNITQLTDIIQKALEKGFSNLNRLTILHVLTNMPTANITIKYHLKGPSNCSSTACATGASSIGDAFRQIQLNYADMMIAGGSEESMSPTNIHSCIKLQAMSTIQYEKPDQSSRPFDKARSGFILGEGSGVVILEELEHALKRNAKIYCELLGYGQSCNNLFQNNFLSKADGYHLTKPQESGEGALLAMKYALHDGGIKVDYLDHINCHATSTTVGDKAEAKAIYMLLNEGDKKLSDITSITASKSSIGHTFGAAGAIESIFTILSIQQKLCPPILNLQEIEDDMPILNFIKHKSQQQNINYALKNAFGFGGVNTSLLFSKFQ